MLIDYKRSLSVKLVQIFNIMENPSRYEGTKSTLGYKGNWNISLCHLHS